MGYRTEKLALFFVFCVASAVVTTMVHVWDYRHSAEARSSNTNDKSHAQKPRPLSSRRSSASGKEHNLPSSTKRAPGSDTQAKVPSFTRRAHDVSAYKPLLLDVIKYYEDLPKKEISIADYDGNSKIKILMYSVQRWMPNMDLSDCEYSNCAMTRKKEDFKSSDAVIFSMNFAVSAVPPVRQFDRPPGQVWVFQGLESPFRYMPFNFNHPLRSSVFNWSMTYRLDSEIPHPYGVFKTRTGSLKKNYTEIFHQKTKFAAWFVSNCKFVYNKRMEFVKQLQKFVPVDILGGCGKNVDNAEWSSGEMGEYLKNYKFYLSFENANCKDYFTEKVITYWPMDTLLVTRGGADYQKLLPNNTFINTSQFKSVKALADYLIKLGSSEDRYSEMLREKDRYETHNQHWVYKNAMCTLCKKLNNRNLYRHTYDDTISWLSKGICTHPKDIVIR